MVLTKYHGLTQQEQRVEDTMIRPLTPKSDRRWEGRIAPVSLLTTRGLCSIGVKCFKRDGHEGACYPLD